MITSNLSTGGWSRVERKTEGLSVAHLSVSEGFPVGGSLSVTHIKPHIGRSTKDLHSYVVTLGGFVRWKK